MAVMRVTTRVPEKAAYSIQEYCWRWDTSRTQVYVEIRQGLLRAVKRGKRTLILHEDALDRAAKLPTVKIGDQPE